VVATRVGYTGGEVQSPTYHALADHTEAVEVVYDPAKIGYADLLDVFWSSHSPTYESARQYRSAIWVHDEEQRTLAQASLAAQQAKRGKKLYTSIEPAGTFWQAEDYHQKWYLSHQPGIDRELRAIYPDEADYLRSTAVARVNAMVHGDVDSEQLEREIGQLGLSPEAQEALRRLAE
jgi:peptide-methionine (S)-S-oxide reductase